MPNQLRPLISEPTNSKYARRDSNPYLRLERPVLSRKLTVWDAGNHAATRATRHQQIQEPAGSIGWYVAFSSGSPERFL
jgi:hypothetical protein